MKQPKVLISVLVFAIVLFGSYTVSGIYNDMQQKADKQKDLQAIYDESFMKACENGDSTMNVYCRCALDELMSRYSYTEAEAVVKNNPAEIQAIAESCYNKF